MKKFYSLIILCTVFCWCFNLTAQTSGCMDANATNYNSAATEDDGSCLYLCNADPADLLDISASGPFDGGTGNSFGNNTSMGLLAGSNNDFAGFIWNINTTGLSNADFCISMDFEVTGGDAADYPMTLEFRIENNGCGGFPCPWNDFNIPISGPGSYTLGGIVSTGNQTAGGFDPAGMNPSIVTAIANFDGTAIVEDVIITFSNLCASTDCGADVLGCTDAAANNFNSAATLDDGSCLYNFTFEVDMNCWDGEDGNIEQNAPYGGAFSMVSVESPTFGWCGGCAPLEDLDLDGIWTGTFEVPAGMFEYKYAIDGFAGQENLVNDMVDGAECAPITDFANFANRQVMVSANGSVSDTYGTCGSCSAPGCTDADASNYDSAATVDDGSCLYDMTFNVDMSCETGFTTPYVTGPFAGWCGDCHPMEDLDGDGIYTTVLAFPANTSVEYKYEVDNWTSQEDLIDDMVAGADCAPITDFFSFANRLTDIVDMPVVNDDVYGTCGECETEPTTVTYCDTLVQHLGIPAETASAIFLSISNTGQNSMTVTIESADNDPVDLIVLNAFGGPITGAPAISAPNTSVPGQISQTLTWNGPAPAVIELNVLWSKVSTPGNWQLGVSNTTVDFSTTCASTGTPGCTDTDAANFNPTASEDDGSCLYDMTFNVDMNCETGFGIPYVTGPFAGWCGDCHPMEDPDGDGIYTTVIAFPANTAVEYKYEVDNWASQEDLIDDMVNGADCAPVTDFFSFANRLVDIIDAPVVNDDTYGTCGVCEVEPSTITYCDTLVQHLGIAAETASAIYLSIANTGSNEMTVTISSANADPVDLIVLNAFGGPITGSPAISAPNTSVPGQISQTLTWAGMPPSVVELNVLWSKESTPGNWQLGSENTFVDFNTMCGPAAIFGCTDNDASNYNPDANSDDGSCLYDMTFNVDMNCETGFVTPYVTGPFAGWCGDCYPMEDPDGDGVYTTVIAFPANTAVEYKYEVDNWTSQEDLIDDMLNGADCAPVTDFATFANRLVDITDAPVVNEDTYGTCGTCGTSGCTDVWAVNYDPDATIDDGSCQYNVTFTVDMNCESGFTTPYVTGPWAGWCGDCYPMTDNDGDGVYVAVIPFAEGTTVEYKYEVDNWTSQEDLIDDMVNGADCAPVTDFFSFANRIVEVMSMAAVTSDVYGTCGDCNPIACEPSNFPDAPVNLDEEFTSIITMLSWDGIPGSLGCQVQGNIVGSAYFPLFLIQGDAPDQYPVNNLHLENGETYQWRVRCGCSADPVIATPWSDWAYFTYNSLLPTEGTIELKDATVFPNPNNGNFNLSVELSEAGPVQIRVYNLLGTVVYDSQLIVESKTQVFDISLEGKERGIYLVDIISDNDKITNKVVIE